MSLNFEDLSYTKLKGAFSKVKLTFLSWPQNGQLMSRLLTGYFRLSQEFTVIEILIRKSLATITSHFSNGAIQTEMDQSHFLNQLDVDQNLAFGSLQARFSNQLSLDDPSKDQSHRRELHGREDDRLEWFENQFKALDGSTGHHMLQASLLKWQILWWNTWITLTVTTRCRSIILNLLSIMLLWLMLLLKPFLNFSTRIKMKNSLVSHFNFFNDHSWLGLFPLHMTFSLKA